MAIYGGFSLVGGFVPAIGRHLVHSPERECAGDLYLLSLVNDFSYPLSACENEKPLEMNPPAKYQMLGDCFFEDPRNGPSFMRMIADGLPDQSGNLFSFATGNVAIIDMIKGREPGSSRGVLVLGFVERNIENYVLERALFASGGRFRAPDKEYNGWELVRYNLSFFDNVLDTKPFDFFYTHNIVFYPILKMLRTMRFNLIGDLGSESLAPFYDSEGKHLFFAQDWHFYQRERSGVRVLEVAERIQSFALEIKQKFNLDLAVFVFPNKLSIYGDKVVSGFRYDAFIPRLASELQARGIGSFDTYSVLQSHQGTVPLYLPSESHLSSAGKQVLLPHLLKVLLDLGSKK